jgi:hypothetical protein
MATKLVARVGGATLPMRRREAGAEPCARGMKVTADLRPSHLWRLAHLLDASSLPAEGLSSHEKS